MSQVVATDYHFCTLNESQSLKPLPSLDFVAKLADICQFSMSLFESGQRNIYDRKNHVLYINNYESYARTLQEKYGRSVASFEKQLKMMGFKKRKIKQHFTETFTRQQEQINMSLNKISSFADIKEDSRKEETKKESIEEHQQNNRTFNSLIFNQKEQKDLPTKYMFVWRTNRSVLIEKQLESLEVALSEEVERAIWIKEEMEKRKRQLDSRLETIIFSSLLKIQDPYFTEMDTQMSPQTPWRSKSSMKGTKMLQSQIDEALKEVKMLSNMNQIELKQMIGRISKNSGLELQLYRMSIYKQSHIHKSSEEQ